MQTNNIPESFYHFLWKYKTLKPNLKTVEGEFLEILDPGIHNNDAGPDFLMAKLRIGPTIWAGNVEIHVKGSDWYRHGHEKDEAYSNVVLHVVGEHDRPVKDRSGRNIQTLCLKGHYNSYILERYHLITQNLLWVPCMHLIGAVDRIIIMNAIHAHAVDRLEEKSAAVQKELVACRHDWEECCYHLIGKQFGSKVNTPAFEMLAKTIPAKVLMKHHHDLFQLEALLFGQSGLLNTRLSERYPRLLRKEHRYLANKYQLSPMPGYLWKFLRLRPAAFPSLRIAQMASLYHKHQRVFGALLEQESIREITGFFKLEASTYWTRHYIFNKKSKSIRKRFGSQGIRLMLINAILPLLYLYGHQMNQRVICDRALSFLEALPPEDNAVIRRWNELGVSATSALETQGLLQLKKKRCDHKRCLDCPIGHAILK